jgi:transcriptional regulator with XRE-family HTH domain
VATRSAQSRFGFALRKLRDERGYPREELAERAGLHRSQVGGVERGKRNVALDHIVKLAKALCVSPSDLITDSPKICRQPCIRVVRMRFVSIAASPGCRCIRPESSADF